METLGKPVEQWQGVGIKVPSKLLEQVPTLIDEWVKHFQRTMIFYIVGEDLTLMHNTNEGEHYHIHFLTSQTVDQIKKRREKFKHKFGPCMKLYFSKKVLSSLDDCLEWLGYAVKERFRQISKCEYPIFGKFLTLDDINPFAICSRKKKENLFKDQQRQQEIKSKKKERKDELIEYIKSQIDVGPYVSQQDVYACLIKWQRENDQYIRNFYMEEVYHCLLHRCPSISDHEIVQRRFKWPI